MRTLKISLLVFLLSMTISEQYHWQNPTPFGNGLSEIQMLTSSLGYACGSGGTLIKTINGGETWFETESGTNDLIIDIFFLTEDVGWFLSYTEREIYKTTNGGLNWNLIGNLLPNSAQSIWFINEMKGYACGYPCLLSTTDGGSTWNEINTLFSPTSIFFIDTMIGFVGGYNVLYKTTNSGNTWSNITVPTLEYHFEDIYAVDQYRIFVVGSGYFQGELYYNFMKTLNGGSSWNGKSFEYFTSSVYFKNINEGFLTSDRIYRTIDGGTTWEPTNYSGSEFEFKDNFSWAIDGWNTIIHSDDFWISAYQQIKSVFSGFLWNGAAKDTNVVFACGSDRTIVGSFDGGHSWNKYYESVGQSYLNAITFHNDEIWTVGSGGVIIKSFDNGNSWEESYVDATWLSDIKFLTNEIGYIVGTDYGLAIIFITQDGGNTWNIQQTFSEYYTIDGIEFSNDTLGWMIADENGLLKSTNFGRTWNVVIDSISQFTDIAVWENSAWFTYFNRVLRTTDAGDTWESFKVFDFDQTIYWGFEIDFISQCIGYVGNWSGNVFKTTDAGETWIQEDYPSAMSIQAIDFVDDKRGWTFGDCGTILKRDPNYVNVEVSLVHNPNDFILSHNYPNPFNPVTKIKYEIPGQARNDNALVTLKVYDILGREVATLVNEEKSAGEYEVEFNGSNLPSGIYFYQLKAGQYSETKKMVLLR